MPHGRPKHRKPRSRRKPPPHVLRRYELKRSGEWDAKIAAMDLVYGPRE
jgi:hypothetical protein